MIDNAQPSDFDWCTLSIIIANWALTAGILLVVCGIGPLVELRKLACKRCVG